MLVLTGKKEVVEYYAATGSGQQINHCQSIVT